MQELIEAGYVYIAKPPLYKLTQGKRERYIEKDSELEEMLLGDKLERFEITDHAGQAFKLTDTRWQRYSRLLKQYEGWASALRADYGHEVVTFLEESQILDEQITTPEALLELLGREDPESEPYTTELIASDDGADPRHARSSARRTSPARTALRRAMFEANEYRQLSRVHAELVKMAGTPPFTVRLGDESDEALSFEDLRRKVMEVAAKGVKLQRFKGLGEMNAEQLRETTMDPDDAHADAGHDGRRGGRRPALHDADGRQGRAAARVHRGERPRRDPGRLMAWRPRHHLRRQHRAPRARGGDALVVSRLRHVRHRRARAARRPRRPEARPPPRAVRDERERPAAEPRRTRSPPASSAT